MFKRLIGSLALAVAALASPLVQGQTSIAQEFFVPLPEDQVQKAFKVLYTSVGPEMQTVISIVVTGNGTVIHYDHWEDGYEPTLGVKTQATTEVWGDGNDANGKPPGFANDPSGLPKGAVISLRNAVPLPRNPGVVLYDGRDRFGSNIAVVAARAQWATKPGTVLAGAAEMLSLRDYGLNFRMPVGQNLSSIDNAMFEYTGLLVVAAGDGTNCTLTRGGSTTVATIPTLNRGSNFQVNGGINAGDALACDKPVQAHLITGDIGANYESRSYLIYPTEKWSSEYYSAVGTAANGNTTYVFFYNPGASSITVRHQTLTGSGTVTVGANSTVRFEMPVSSGGYFASVGGEPFYAVATVGAKPTSNNVNDWGFLLVPKGRLTTELVAGWAPGDGNVPPTVANKGGSPLWVTAEGDTTVYVDYRGNGGSLTAPNGQAYDVAVSVRRLQSVIVEEPSADNTGTRLFTADGTLITGAWGQNPAKAGAAAPFLDMGTALLPFPVPNIKKDGVVTTDTGDAGLSVNDVVTFTITVDNAGLTTLATPTIVDNLGGGAGNLTYVAGSTQLNGSPVADGPSSAFPLASPGLVLPDILPGDTSTLTYRASVARTGSIINTASLAGTNIRGSKVLNVPIGNFTCALTFAADAAGATPTSSYPEAATQVHVKLTSAQLNLNAGAADTVAIQVNNPANGSKDSETLFLTETGIATGIFLGSLTRSGTTGQGPNDGTLYLPTGDTVSAIYPGCTDATATVQVPTETKRLYLSTDGGDNDNTGSLDRVDPADSANPDSTTSQTATLVTAAPAGVTFDAASSGGVATGSSTVTVSHTTGSGSDRLMLVGVSYSKDDPTISSVTYGGTALTAVSTNQGSDFRTRIYRLIAPASGTANVVVTFSASIQKGAIVNVTTFSGVDQTTPLGTANSADGDSTSPSVAVTSVSGDLVYDVLTSETGSGTITVGANQTLNGTAPTDRELVRQRSSRETATGASTTMSYSFQSQKKWAIAGVAIKAASSGGGSANTTATFTQTPSFASNFVIPAGQTITVKTYYTLVSGSIGTAVTANLKVGSTTVLTDTTATAGSDTGGTYLEWSGTLGSPLTVLSGEALTLEVVTALASTASFKIDYDSATKRSLISLPTTTVIAVDSVSVHTAAFPASAAVTEAENGNTLYIRAQVSDPFGNADITGADLGITAPAAACDLTAALGEPQVVATTAGTKTYEYAWNTDACEGTYDILVTAREGSEGEVTATGATTINLRTRDTGTPSTVEFIDSSGNDKTVYSTSQQVCLRVTDLDQAGRSEPIVVQVTGSIGGVRSITLTADPAGSRFFTGCFGTSGSSSPFVDGEVLSARYQDPTDDNDVSTDSALVDNTPPGVLVAKTLLVPVDGIAVVGESVSFDISVTNLSSSSSVGPFTVTDTFSGTCYTFVSAVPAPSTTAAGQLTWTGVSLSPGASFNATVNFTAAAACTTAEATNTVSDGSNSASANALLTRPGVTVTKTRTSASPTRVGNTVTYDIAIKNTGTTAITSLPVSDAYSTCLTFVSATSSPTVAAPSAGGGAIYWANAAPSGSLAAGATVTLSTTFTAAAACADAANTAEVGFAVDANGDAVPEARGSATVVVQTVADMVSAISGLPAVGAPGSTVTGTLTCTNNGPSVAESATCTASGGSPGSVKAGSCTASSGTAAALPVGATLTCPLTVVLPGTAGGTDTTQTSYVVNGTTSASNEVTTNNNASSGTVSIIDAVNDTASVNRLTGGSTASVLGNDAVGGTAAAVSGTANVTLAADGAQSCTGCSGTPSTLTLNADGTITVPANAVGGVYQVPYKICSTVATAACDTAVATVTVSADSADLVVSKNGPVAIAASGTLVYSVRVSNAGPAAANGAVFADPVPAGVTNVTWVCGNAVGGAVCPSASGSGAISQTLATFPAGGSVTYTITSAAPATGPVVNTATVTAPAGLADPDTTNNTDSVSTVIGTVPATADLSVVKYGPAQSSPSAAITYVVVVANAGYGAANGAVFADTLPGALGTVNWTCVAVGGAVCPNASGSGTSISETIATFPSGGSLTYTITGTAPASGSLTNTATITAPAGVTDPNPGNNTSTVTTALVATTASADLSVVKTGPDVVAAGASVAYKLIVANGGPDAADGAVITDDLPSVLTTVTWTCAATGGAVCPNASGSGAAFSQTIATFPAGSSLTYTITGTAPAVGAFGNTARVTPPAGTQDPAPDNNVSGTVITRVLTPVLSITKSHTGNFVAGSTGNTYTVTVTNGGPAATSGTVTVTENPPSGMTVTAIAGTGWTCGTPSGSNPVACTRSNALASGASYPAITVTVSIASDATSPLVNSVTVSGGGSPDATATDSTVITQPTPVQANLAVSKTGTASVVQGNAVSYTIVVSNAGPDGANGAVVQDAAVANFTATTVSCGSATGGASCPGSPTVSQLQSGLAIPTLPSGGSVTFTLSGTASAAGTITNVATITAPAGVTDPTPGNNSSTATTTVTAPPPAPGSIAGFVWFDLNGNRLLDGSEPLRSGWKVELFAAVASAGASAPKSALGATTTGADGRYRFESLTPGQYEVRFTPSGSVPGGGAVNGDTGGNGGTPSGTRLLNITVPAGTAVVNQSLPLDPSGVVYDSVTRGGVPNATVTLLYNGAPADPAFVAGGFNSQPTAGSGYYAFFLLPGSPSGTWGLRVDPLPGYSGTPSANIPPSTAPGGFQGGSVGTVGAPPVGGVTTYYLAFPLPSIDIVNNNLPIDPAVAPQQIPTLGFWALLLLSLAMGAFGTTALRRRGV